MSGRTSHARAALLGALSAGLTGTYDALADMAGISPDTARVTLKELSRDGHVCAYDRQRRTGQPGAPRAVYGAYQQPMDSLGFVRRVWR